ncbi:hypothetical protein BKA93DRAFT_753895 [Sparassis latifolia]
MSSAPRILCCKGLAVPCLRLVVIWHYAGPTCSEVQLILTSFGAEDWWYQALSEPFSSDTLDWSTAILQPKCKDMALAIAHDHVQHSLSNPHSDLTYVPHPPELQKRVLDDMLGLGKLTNEEKKRRACYVICVAAIADWVNRKPEKRYRGEGVTKKKLHKNLHREIEKMAIRSLLTMIKVHYFCFCDAANNVKQSKLNSDDVYLVHYLPNAVKKAGQEELTAALLDCAVIIKPHMLSKTSENKAGVYIDRPGEIKGELRNHFRVPARILIVIPISLRHLIEPVNDSTSKFLGQDLNLAPRGWSAYGICGWPTGLVGYLTIEEVLI